MNRVVGRLVQQEDVRPSEQQPRQFGPHDPTTAELIHIAREIGLLEAEAGQNCFRLMVAIFPTGGRQSRTASCRSPRPTLHAPRRAACGVLDGLKV